ncbi:Arginyl-tRNA synthetase [Hordeum vulgare]|nr:Arginyl-tRNA synthetase [Hordeum vulgare]
MERLRLARRFGGTIKSCMANRCYAESCLVCRCYARQFFQNLRVWTNDRRAVALFGAVVASIILHGAFGGDVKSCLADRCYAVSCLVGSVGCGVGMSLIVVDRANVGDKLDQLDNFDGDIDALFQGVHFSYVF